MKCTLRTLPLALALTPFARGGDTCNPDVLEENDSCAAAISIAANTEYDLTLQGPAAPGGADDDFFVVNVPAEHALRVLPLIFQPPYDLLSTIYGDASCSVPLATGDALSEFARVYNDTGADADYWIRIEANDPGFDCNAYCLTADVALDPCPTLLVDGLEPNDSLATANILTPGVYPNLSVFSDNADYYVIDLEPFQLLRHTITSHIPTLPWLEPDIHYYDSTGTLISGGYVNQESVFFNFTESDQLSLRVSVPYDFNCNTYTLDFAVEDTPCGALGGDLFEPNDDCSTPALLPLGVTQGLSVSFANADFYEIAVPDGDAVRLEMSFDQSLGDLYMRVWRNCNSNAYESVYIEDGLHTSVFRNHSGAMRTYQVFISISHSGENYNPEAPCNSYDLLARLYSDPVGANYCTALPNSAGTTGKITAWGSTTGADNELALLADDLPVFKPGIFYFGPNQIQVPFGMGIRCVGGMTQRLQPTRFSSQARIFHVVDFNQPPASTNFVPGATLNFQLWHRDGGSSSNLTDGVELSFQ